MDHDEYIAEGRGRSAKKREVQEIAKLAARAVEFPDAVVKSLELDDVVQAAFTQARQTKGRGARKRALKYFAGKLREDEEARETLHAAMSQLDGARGQEAANYQAVEKLREQLCSAQEHAAALQVVADNYPSVDQKALLRLIKSARKRTDKRAFREIFRLLRAGRES